MKKKSRGNGRVFRRGRLFWVAFYHDGKEIRKPANTEKESEAWQFLRDQIAAIASGHFVTGDGQKLTVNDLADLVERDYRINERRSLFSCQDRLAYVRRYFGSTRAIDVQDVAPYVDQRKAEGAKNATIRYELALLKRGYKLASKRLAGHVPEIPDIVVKNARKGFFEESDFRALLPHLDEELRGVVTFAYLTGWRVKSEIFPLQWPQVDFQAGEVRLEVQTTKNDEGRVFPINVFPELREVLDAQRRYTDAIQRQTGRIIPWVFHRQGERVRDIRGAWEHAITAAGLAGRIPHDFRRTAVRSLERAGVPRSVAMQLVGHKTESIYRRYSIVAPKDLVYGAQMLAQYRESLDKSAEQKVVSIERSK